MRWHERIRHSVRPSPRGSATSLHPLILLSWRLGPDPSLSKRSAGVFYCPLPEPAGPEHPDSSSFFYCWVQECAAISCGILLVLLAQRLVAHYRVEMTWQKFLRHLEVTLMVSARAQFYLGKTRQTGARYQCFGSPRSSRVECGFGCLCPGTGCTGFCCSAVHPLDIVGVRILPATHSAAHFRTIQGPLLASGQVSPPGMLVPGRRSWPKH